MGSSIAVAGRSVTVAKLDRVRDSRRDLCLMIVIGPEAPQNGTAAAIGGGMDKLGEASQLGQLGLINQQAP